MAVTVAEKLLNPLGTRKKWLPAFVGLAFAVFIWGAVGLGPYSGENTPPEYGDFEAQRHWMELTTSVKTSEWYFYDFSWWRLDYPPLTAYHSWLCGKIGNLIDPSWFKKDVSRGLETPELKAYMRLTAVISELVVFGLSSWRWIVLNIGDNSAHNEKRAASNTPLSSRGVAFAWILLFPSLTIIDHGHFQYNSVMLGLTTAALTALVQQKFVLGSIFFVNALFFKQMSLYYAPVIFCAILGYCIGPAVSWELNLKRLIAVATTVIVSSAVLLAPFLDLEQLKQIVERVFPVFRGLWEDKVANLWCTLNYTVIKLKVRFDAFQLQILALGATLVGIGPSCIGAFIGKPKLWAWAFASCAWSFFLFSFQVHEKSVLLPLLPTMLTAIQHHTDANIYAMVQWIGNISYFSMWPLIKREGLHLQYFVLLALFNWVFTARSSFLPRNWLNKLVVTGSYAAFLALGLTEAFGLLPFPIAAKYPDLLVVGNMTASFGCFAYFWLWQTWYMLTLTTLG